MAASKQAYTHTIPQCSPASVGLAQARPNYKNGEVRYQPIISHGLFILHSFVHLRKKNWKRITPEADDLRGTNFVRKSNDWALLVNQRRHLHYDFILQKVES